MPTLGVKRVGGGGGGPYGGIPAQIPIPPSIYQQTQQILPGLPDLTRGAGGVAASELAGQLSPETIARIQDEGAAWGVSSGMGPRSGLALNRQLRNLGLNVEQTQRAGVQDYLSTLTGTGSTLLNPSLISEVQNRNAIMAAAPDPAAAAAEQERQWMEKFMLTRGSGGSHEPTWYDLTHPQPANVMAGAGGILPSSGTGSMAITEPPMVSASAGSVGAGPISFEGSPVYDDILKEFLDPEAYYFGGDSSATV